MQPLGVHAAACYMVREADDGVPRLQLLVVLEGAPSRVDGRL
jgi:hypothetical protein